MSYSRYAVTEDERTARHEVGHGLVTIWNGLPLAHVRVEGTYGETSVNFGLHQTSYDLRNYATQYGTHALWVKVRSIAQVLMSGVMAEEYILVDDDARKLAEWKHEWQEAATKKPIGSWNLLVLEAEQQVRHWFAAPRVEQLLSCMTTLLLREQWVPGERFAQVVRNHSARLLIASPPIVSRPAPDRSSAAATHTPKPKPSTRSTPSTGRSAPARRVPERYVPSSRRDWRTGGVFLRPSFGLIA